jgi:tRNA(fMet)-specific endonuclease VapC
MKLLLDTDICIYTINRREPGPLARLQEFALGDIGISAITYAELRFGVENSTQRVRNLDALERFVLPLEVMPFDAAAGRAYGEIRLQLKREGLPIGGNDLLIAAHAVSLDVTLVTNNIRELERVNGLHVEQWS